jgi:hypothetical protein
MLRSSLHLTRFLLMSVTESQVESAHRREVRTFESERRVTKIAIPTADRPDLFERLLGTLHAAGLSEIDGIELVVVDDSRSAAARARNLLIAERSAMPVTLIDRLGRARLAAELSCKTGSERRVLHHALVGRDEMPTFGAAQNSLLLLTKGAAVLSLDDDICANRVVMRSILGKLSPGEHPECVWFFHGREDLPRGEPLAISWLLDELAQALIAGSADDPTCIALLGLAGDPGACSSANLITPSNWVTARNAQLSEDHYRLARATRSIVKVAPDHCIRRPGPMMTAAYAVRNDLPLIPFFPELRGSDALFGAMMGAYFPHYHFHYTPFALPHEPPEQRSFTEDLSTLRFSTLVAAIMDAIAPGQPSRAIAPGKALAAFVSCSLPEFERRLVDVVNRYFTGVLERLELQLASGFAGYTKTADIAEQANKILARIVNADFGIDDLAGDHVNQSREAKRLLEDWLSVCSVWPQLEASMNDQFAELAIV